MRPDFQEVEKLLPIIAEQFAGKTSAITESEIQKFLQSSETIRVSSDLKLMALASRLPNIDVYLDWSSYRLIYDLALQQDHDSLDAIRAVWLGLALGDWLQTPALHPVEDRMLAAEFAEELLRELWELDPKDHHTAHSFGLINYHFPDRTSERLHAALTWFTIAVNLADDALDALDSIVGIGDSNFYLGNWSEAFTAYERLDKPLFEHLERERQEQIKKNILECKKNLNSDWDVHLRTKSYFCHSTFIPNDDTPDALIKTRSSEPICERTEIREKLNDCTKFHNGLN